MTKEKRLLQPLFKIGTLCAAVSLICFPNQILAAGADFDLPDNLYEHINQDKPGKTQESLQEKTTSLQASPLYKSPFAEQEPTEEEKAIAKFAVAKQEGFKQSFSLLKSIADNATNKFSAKTEESLLFANYEYSLKAAIAASVSWQDNAVSHIGEYSSKIFSNQSQTIDILSQNTYNNHLRSTNEIVEKATQNIALENTMVLMTKTELLALSLDSQNSVKTIAEKTLPDLPSAAAKPSTETPPIASVTTPQQEIAPVGLQAVTLPFVSPTQPMQPVKSESAISDQSKAIVNALPKEKSPPKDDSPKQIDMQHIQSNALDSSNVQKHEGVGIKISVATPKVNIDQLLENAYDDVMEGNQERAISLYKQVLGIQPSNKLALFGLATTYHRAGQIQLARPLYGRLLSLYPNHVEGLNNFLVLLSDESPEQALIELQKLEKNHPSFSPIPAQMAIIYDKSGNYDMAVKKMNQAIELSPENLKYRYNMAIMLDKQNNWQDAAIFYKQLLTAYERGERIPAKTDEIQQRLTFIATHQPTVKN